MTVDKTHSDIIEDIQEDIAPGEWDSVLNALQGNSSHQPDLNLSPLTSRLIS